MDMMNPFPYALGDPPPRGGISAAAYQYTLSDAIHPSPDFFFGDASLVIVPKRPAAESYFDGFYAIYKDELLRRYRLVAESELWYLYRLHQADAANTAG
jgi:hypothetical protein